MPGPWIWPRAGIVAQQRLYRITLDERPLSTHCCPFPQRMVRRPPRADRWPREPSARRLGGVAPLSPLRPIHHQVDFCRLAHREQTSLLAPLNDGGGGAAVARKFRELRLDLTAALPTPHDQPHTDHGGSAKRHGHTARMLEGHESQIRWASRVRFAQRPEQASRCPRPGHVRGGPRAQIPSEPMIFMVTATSFHLEWVCPASSSQGG